MEVGEKVDIELQLVNESLRIKRRRNTVGRSSSHVAIRTYVRTHFSPILTICPASCV